MRQTYKKAEQAMSFLSSVAILLLLWWLLSLTLKSPAVPLPLDALHSFLISLRGELLSHLGVSLYRVLLSLLSATLLAVPLGIFLGKNPEVDRKAAPLLYLTYPIPKVVFMPIFLIILGIGDSSKILLITLITFYQILVTTRDAAKNMAKEYIFSLKSLGASSWDLYRHVYLPGCLPAILTALRLGLGTAMAVLFLAETYATQTGIGFFIMDSLSRMNYEEMFAGIIAMGLMGFFLYILLDQAEKILCSWIHI
ncbi:binding-protein-dependent transport systems inner membrane component [Desulforamulus reducens MI-1]|uniref:Binding-protein-dependent transport systems inner membrane component n=1 Tax=Desulforamulus reducens (strain ATCC BAA-1160 / DSM 100696 / MI-1) TaxID=349161 RepID=A4J881_DESRM|nr:ABC transporter permease [Desulforamulus reducens]ABO51284.1 binding-protein-dependent transport systems inner membrane component [Desulforamulus reducens MI-1]